MRSEAAIFGPGTALLFHPVRSIPGRSKKLCDVSGSVGFGAFLVVPRFRSCYTSAMLLFQAAHADR
jgi:hypothetical protein